MGKKKGNSQPHASQSFQELLAQATLQKFAPYIQQQINYAAQGILQRQAQASANIFTRLIATEEVLMELVPGLTKERLATQVASVQDRNEGLEESLESVQIGDRVRVEIKTKTADQTEYQGTSRMLIDNIGSGATLGKELEDNIIGMAKGETREVLFGKDNSLSASITLNRVSRLTKEEAEARARAIKEESAQQGQEDQELKTDTAAPQEAVPVKVEETENVASAG